MESCPFGDSHLNYNYILCRSPFHWNTVLVWNIDLWSCDKKNKLLYVGDSNVRICFSSFYCSYFD